MKLLDEPQGWQALQALAQRERDSQKLEAIIARMNHLLDCHEWCDDESNPDEPTPRNKASGNSPEVGACA